MTTITLYKWTNYQAVTGRNKGFSLSGTMSFEFVGDVEEGQYHLPPGYELAESNMGTMEFYDPNGRCCTIELAAGDLPMLCAAGRMVVLKKALPDLAGVSECCEILGWKKQQVYEYRKRGVFPDPIQTIASGPIWTRKQIEDYRDSRK